MASYFSRAAIDASLCYFNDGAREIILKNNNEYGFFVGLSTADSPGLAFHRSYTSLIDAKRKWRELVG